MKILPPDAETQRIHADLLGLYPDFVVLDVRNPKMPEIVIPAGRLPVPGGLDGLAGLLRIICPT